MQSMEEITKIHDIHVQMCRWFKLLFKPKSHYAFKAREILQSLFAELSADYVYNSRRFILNRHIPKS